MKQLTIVCLFLCVSGSITTHAWGDGKPKEEKVFKATVGSAGVQQVEILGGSYFFTPNHIIVKMNVPVELTVKKEAGIVAHNIMAKAPEAGIDFEIALGSEPKIIKFTPTKTGNYPFYCNKRLWPFEGHRGKGMEGTIEVIE